MMLLRWILSRRLILSCMFSFCSLSLFAEPIAQTPVSILDGVPPKVMFVMSKDHQMWKKAYSDYNDLNQDGAIDTTYNNDIEYDGYFNPQLCYQYRQTVFHPKKKAVDHRCNDATAPWSGNFLNWATMSRIDMVRKVLYGGKRKTDPVSGTTILETALIPRDIHSFGKMYTNTAPELQASHFTPATGSTISLCVSNQRGLPTFLATYGQYPLWAFDEVNQCKQEGRNVSPHSNDTTDYRLQIEVCTSLDQQTRPDFCKTYPGQNNTPVQKPIGLLQRFGEDVHFGLLTGSYYKSNSGGILSAPIGEVVGSSARSEFDTQTGVLIHQEPQNQTITNTLNRLKIAKYDGSRYSDCRVTRKNLIRDSESQTISSQCSNWGNPIGEMYWEALRYLQGEQEASPIFFARQSDEDTFVEGLPRLLQWTDQDPWPETERCANCSIIVISSGANSFDFDFQLRSVNSLADGLMLSHYSSGEQSTTRIQKSLDRWVDEIGEKELVSNSSTIIGKTKNRYERNQEQCTAKPLGVSPKLSQFRGLCPDAPSLEGSYAIAGLAYFAQQDLRSHADQQQVTTYAMSLAETLPIIDIHTPEGPISYIPYCDNYSYRTLCSPSDLIFVKQITDDTGTLRAAHILIGWEDQLWGGDYDIDMMAETFLCTENYCDDLGLPASENLGVGSQKLRVIQGVPYKATFNKIRSSYELRGAQGTHSYLDRIQLIDTYQEVNEFIKDRNAQFKIPLESRYLTQQQPRYSYTNMLYQKNMSANPSINLPSPLELAAKYGGGEENYFSVANFSELDQQLAQILQNVIRQNSTSTIPATSSTRFNTGTQVFSASYNNQQNWQGDISSYKIIRTNNSQTLTLEWKASEQLLSPAQRKILTWDSTQQKGIDCTENTNFSGCSSELRQNILGDIVHSSPIYISNKGFMHYRDQIDLTDCNSTSNFTGCYSVFSQTQSVTQRPTTLAVGANDGFLHLLNTKEYDTSGGTTIPAGQILFSYFPSMLEEPLNTHLQADEPSHRYFVDGQTTVVDAKLNLNNTLSWQTILIGSLGRGGAGYFGLNVTDMSFDSDNVLWEISPEIEKQVFDSDVSYMGASLSPPAVFKTGKNASYNADTGWYLGFGNGVKEDNDDGYYYLWPLVNHSREWTASSGRVHRYRLPGAKGIISHAPLDTNGDDQVDTIYLADLKGQIWRIDLLIVNNGALEIRNAPKITKVFEIGESTSAPVTADIEASLLGDGRVMLFWGTGQYLYTDDRESKKTEYIIGLIDNPRQPGSLTSAKYDLTDLNQILFNNVANSPTLPNRYRYFDRNTIIKSDSQGWYITLQKQKGERVLDVPAFYQGSIFFTSMLPPEEACGFEENSWLYILNPLTGRPLSQPILDLNNDGIVNHNDLGVDSDGKPVVSSAIEMGRRVSTAVILQGNDKDAVVFNALKNSAAPVEVTAITPYRAQGTRLSWREVHLD